MTSMSLGAEAHLPPGERRRSRLGDLIPMFGPLVVVALCWMRSPELMTKGRFWAEDSMFFGHMLHSDSFAEKVSYVYKGHLEIITALSHAIASYLDPRLAPLFTAYVDLSIECLLAYMIVRFRDDFSIRLLPALALCALLVVSPCASEHYLNMVNSQWLTSAILFVIINLPERRLQGRPIVVALSSFVLGLSGISSAALFPVAVLYAFQWRSRPHVLIATGLLASCVIQGALILTHPLESRFLPASPYVYIVAPFLQIVVKHLMGADAENNVADWFRNGPMAAGTLSSFVVLPLFMLISMARRIYAGASSSTGLLLLSLLFITLFNELGAVGDRNNMVGIYMMRYFFLPSLIVGIMAARWASSNGSKVSFASRYLIYIALLVSSIDFFTSDYNASLVTPQYTWTQDLNKCDAQASACHIEIGPGGYFVDFDARR